MRNTAGSAETLRSDPRYAALPASVIPDSESLADVLARVLPYWVDTLSADLLSGRVPLVVAHGNSLRALIMHLDQLSEDEVVELNIPLESRCATSSITTCAPDSGAAATSTPPPPSMPRPPWPTKATEQPHRMGCDQDPTHRARLLGPPSPTDAAARRP